LIIFEDSRQQAGKHRNVHRQLGALGHQVVRTKLYVGDYQLANRGDVVVDTKKDMLELAMDICRDHKRFSEECRKAHDAGIRLVILTEEPLPEGGLASWKSPTWKTTTARHKAGDAISQVKPETLYKAIHTMSGRYGVEFHFCSKEETGNRIAEILTGGSKP
jgi:hypothetical protein